MKEITRLPLPLLLGKPGTSSSNTHTHDVHQKVQQTNVHVIHSTGVNTSTEASGSKPRSNTKKNRILPAKTESKKKVEDHPRTNKSVWIKVNRVDSSISSKCVVINSNSESVCKTCNKCLKLLAIHEMCVVNILNFVNATPTVKIVLNKGKQIWKPKGKLSNNSLNKTKQVWKAMGKLFANVGYQWISTGKKVALGKLNCGYQWRPTGKKFALDELVPSLRLYVQCHIGHPLVSGLRLFKTYDEESFKAHELCGKVHRYTKSRDLDTIYSRRAILIEVFSARLCCPNPPSEKGLPNFEVEKDHLCSACQLGKSTTRSNDESRVLNEENNLVTLDDYSRFHNG
ncbi:hypothetical protein Tco_0893556 [Tanacetum coccineum]|uniref:GAG-pre-integrase domain-containing protein n=1 Tax=Tanacetum coccineum TaxID=301880 RepID=A0ABQ5CFH0_9ASTR